MVLWSGERLENKVVAGPGDFLYIPSGYRTWLQMRAITSLLWLSSPGQTQTSKKT
jgi:ethanolamine utilization protein EutQ (cupin superfamily)